MSKKRKILFVALASSSHTHSWIKLFEQYEDLEISLFGVNGSFVEDFKEYHYKGERLIRFLHGIVLNFLLKLKLSESFIKWSEYYLFRLLYLCNHKRLKNKIKRFKPDVIHTLGFEPSGFELLKIIEQKKNGKSFKWIHTSRGSELSLKGYLPEKSLKKVLQECDFFIADNHIHYQIARNFGLPNDKTLESGIMPGSGGFDITEIDKLDLIKNSDRERIIIWPKAYECPFSKALPVFEALKLCWDDIKPCKIIMAAAIDETKMWFKNLPDEIQKSSQIMGRIDRNEYLELLKSSKVMLAPSLSDGIPNSLYEAMAYGVIPIVSPINTIKEFCDEHQISVIYAENLYPEKVASALTEALNHVEDRDTKFRNNQLLVRKLADRDKIKAKIHEVYKTI